MKKDILMLDCDGTCVLGKTRTMTDFTYNILKQAQDKFYLVFNTGRNLNQFFEVINNEHIIGDYVICLNGKALYDLKNKKYLQAPAEEFTQNQIVKIMDLASMHCDVQSHFFDKTNCYDNPTNCNNLSGIMKYIARSTNEQQLEDLFLKIQKDFNDCFCELARVGGKSGKWIELWKTQSNKKDLVPLLLSMYPNYNKFYYFGDSDNDLEVIKLADVKIVPQNAIDELKQLADIVLPETCDQDGVAKYIQTLL